MTERLRRGGRWIEDENRLAAVAADYDLRIDRDFAEEGDAEEFGGFAAAAVAEDFFALAAVAADEVAHVLDDAEDGHVDFAEHRQPFAGIDQRHLLRRRYHDGTRQWQLLPQ